MKSRTHRHFRRLGTRLSALNLALMLILGLSGVALAHPLGDFSVSRYSRLELEPDGVHLFYVIDMAEVVTFQERSQIDTNGDGSLSDAEQQRYLQRMTETLAQNLHLRLDGRAMTLAAQDQSMEFRPGNGDLVTQRMEFRFLAPLPAEAAAWQLSYEDENYTDRIGWRETVVRAGDNMVLLESDAPTEDVSQALIQYPEDGLQLNNASANLRFEPAGFSGESSSVDVGASRAESVSGLSAQRVQDPFSELINASLSGPLAIALVLLAAMGWGAAHALTPGHGKTIVAAYLVGSRGTIGHALVLGLTTTITHTAGVFLLGFVTLFASRYILPEQLYPWMGALSGALVVGIGLMLLRSYAPWRRREDAHVHSHAHHPHTHDDGHSHAHEAHHHSDHDHDHGPAHSHDHEHDHSHETGSVLVGEYHSHGGGPAHRHALPGEKITWGSLLALGISGGLIPCPSALVVMLSAIALQRIGFGLVLIVMFSLGLAGVLVAIGVVWVKARDLIERSTRTRGWLNRNGWTANVVRILPAASAAFIILVGLGITLQALMQAGIVAL